MGYEKPHTKVCYLDLLFKNATRRGEEGTHFCGTRQYEGGMTEGGKGST